jgi:hypothetical protein
MPINLVWLRIVKSAASLSRVIELLVLPSNQQTAAALIDVETKDILGLLSIAFVNVGYRGLQGAELSPLVNSMPNGLDTTLSFSIWQLTNQRR